jgi:hypothetical protein
VGITARVVIFSISVILVVIVARGIAVAVALVIVDAVVVSVSTKDDGTAFFVAACNVAINVIEACVEAIVCVVGLFRINTRYQINRQVTSSNNPAQSLPRVEPAMVRVRCKLWVEQESIKTARPGFQSLIRVVAVVFGLGVNR